MQGEKHEVLPTHTASLSQWCHGKEIVVYARRQGALRVTAKTTFERVEGAPTNMKNGIGTTVWTTQSM